VMTINTSHAQDGLAGCIPTAIGGSSVAARPPTLETNL
jgi:hypothetical protein